MKQFEPSPLNAVAPPRFQQFARKHPELMQAYEALSIASGKAGPLNARERELLRLALAIGAFREGAVHSHTRRALAGGCSPEEIRQVVLLAITTLGFPTMMAAWTWVEDILAGPHSSHPAETTTV